MKKIVLMLFMLGNLVSYAFQINNKLENEIKRRGFEISENKENSIVFSNSEEKIKVSFERFDKNYIKKLEDKNNYILEDTEKQKEEDETMKLQTENFVFKNTETEAKHIVVSNVAIVKNKKIEYILEIIVEKGHENDINLETILDIPEKELIRRIENLIEVKDKYIGLLENEDENLSDEDYYSDLNLIKRMENQDAGTSVSTKENKLDKGNKEGIIDKVDNFLNGIKKYKATKKPFFSKELSINDIARKPDGFIYDLRTRELVSGVITMRDYNGTVYYEENVKKGLSDGKYNVYYIDFDGERTPKIIGKYSQGVKEGTWKEYYENGEKKEVRKYNNGVLEGKYESYYMNKKLKSEGEYKDNKKTGKWIYYYQNGNKESEGKYNKDEKIKKWKYYNVNGKVREEKRHSFF